MKEGNRGLRRVVVVRRGKHLKEVKRRGGTALGRGSEVWKKSMGFKVMVAENPAAMDER